MRRLVLTFAFVLFPILASAQNADVEIEANIAFPIYNDVGVPGDSDRFSIVDGWTYRAAISPRVRIGYWIGDRHEISAMAALLRLNGYGLIGQDVTFDGREYGGRHNAEAFYRFDSYRLGYRYFVADTENLSWTIGATAKVRSAVIRLTQHGQSRETTDLGVVPLLSTRLTFGVHPVADFVIDAEGLIGPQGRAIDALLALDVATRENMLVRIGVRLLEGGADVDQVYNFAAVGYGVVGIRLTL
jgi:hypothetical protein